MTNTKKKTYPHNYLMERYSAAYHGDTKSVPQRNRITKLLDNAMVHQQLVTFTNNLKQKQLLHNYRSEHDRIRGELAQRNGSLAGQAINRLEHRKTELEHLAAKLLKK